MSTKYEVQPDNKQLELSLFSEPLLEPIKKLKVSDKKVVPYSTLNQTHPFMNVYKKVRNREGRKDFENIVHSVQNLQKLVESGSIQSYEVCSYIKWLSKLLMI
jgi:hypothetical protein